MINTLHTDEIRSRFSNAMSAMYRQEVPLYSDLIDLVVKVNKQVLDAKPQLKQQLAAANELNRLDEERHGAIRIGTGCELNNIRRLFAVMGMYPVGYYDLSVAGLPVHSTAFRPIDKASLAHSPFRVFTSLLRLELLEDRELAEEAGRLLAKRQIITVRALELIEIAELSDGLNEAQAKEFISEALETFRWHSRATVNDHTYQRLKSAHGLIADVVSFQGPHINHLTPRTLDIDLAQQAMIDQGLVVKTTIEGPPCRQIPILLRQTSFKALAEKITFLGDVDAMHTARFGEIEQRGAALTKKGRQLYDQLLNSINQDNKEKNPPQYNLDLAKVFDQFPSEIRELHDEKLVFFKYHADLKALTTKTNQTVEDLIDIGVLILTVQVYEDFLPVSAAGIFQSNLNSHSQSSYTQQSNQHLFEEHLGTQVIDEMALYKEIEVSSLKDALFVIKSAKPL
jgi:uncharacterized glyoxalase superfamily metalloenzyme YdcJ